MEKSKLFLRLSRMAGSNRLEGHRGLSVVHSRILDRLEKWELARFERACKPIRLDSIPVKQGERIISWI